MNAEFVELINKANDDNIDAKNTIHDYFFRNLHKKQTFDDAHINFYVNGTTNKKSYSMFHLAMMYFEGLGVEKNYDKFVELLEESCKLECSQAVYTRAVLYKLRDPKSKQYIVYIKRAMMMNNSSAYLERSFDVLNPNNDKIDMYDSIEFYFENLREKKLSDIYVAFLNESVRLGNTTAMCHLGLYYKNMKEYEKSKKIWKECCDKGNPRGYVGYGHFYRYGYDGEIDLVKAIEFYKKAADGGINEIYPIIGDIYLEMNDKKSAKEQYKLGMNKNDPDSFCRAGDLIINGEHKGKQKKIAAIERANKLYSKGEKLGSILCREHRYGAIEKREKLLYGKNFHKMFKNFGAYDLY